MHLVDQFMQYLRISIKKMDNTLLTVTYSNLTQFRIMINVFWGTWRTIISNRFTMISSILIISGFILVYFIIVSIAPTVITAIMIIMLISSIIVTDILAVCVFDTIMRNIANTRRILLKFINVYLKTLPSKVIFYNSQ